MRFSIIAIVNLSFRVGDTVRYRLKPVSSKVRDVSAKMLLRWSEPMVIYKVRPNVVLLAHPDTGVFTRRNHVSQLKKCAVLCLLFWFCCVFGLLLTLQPSLLRVAGRVKAVCILTPSWRDGGYRRSAS
jgi:hypothetical protein